MSIRFYRSCGAASLAGADALPPGFELRSWRPATDGPPPVSPHLGQNLAWLAFDRVGVFGARAFEELSIWWGERLAHRLVVTPRWLRFPFMAEQDLQIGGLWTSPDVRRLGLASAAMAEAHRRHAAPGRAFWYVVDDANAASIALAEAFDYDLVGTGRRTRPFGVAALGQFRLDPPSAPA